ncbi:hypothetical protein RQP46_000633 [Phenoliferia psychrophenolica]
MLGALIFSLYPLLVVSAPIAGPTVSTPDGSTWVGKAEDLTKTEGFYGIPFAQPPVGNLRFAPPVAPTSSFGVFDASAYGPSCPQGDVFAGTDSSVLELLGNAALDLVNATGILGGLTGGQEDCLTINVQRPVGTTAASRLPVLFWIYGGGFQIGGSSWYENFSHNIIKTAVEAGQPVIYVSVNYRVSSFGFLPGAEVGADPTATPNAGLMDQRLGLEWVQKNIASFGGDPARVTAQGESAGAISIGMHMIAYGGKLKGLFRGAIMESGSPIPVEGPERGQPAFDTIAAATGCSTAPDKIACLRAVPYADLLAATNLVPFTLSYKSMALSFIPRTDGVFLPKQAQDLIADGSYAKDVAIISGDQYDEATIFALGTLNLTTTADVDDWLKHVMIPHSTDEQRAEVLRL